MFSAQETKPVVGRPVLAKTRHGYRVAYLRVSGTWADDADSSPLYGVECWQPLPEEEDLSTMQMLFPESLTRIDGRRRETLVI